MNGLSRATIIRLAVSFAGALGLILLVWLLGPLVGLEGTGALLVCAAVILGVWGLVNFLISWRAARAETSMISALSGEDRRDDTAAASVEEVQALGERLREALTLIRKTAGDGKSGKSGKGDGLYSLPWYLIIGPPGSGKTTALVNSGLHFPLADRFGRKPVKGIGGTRSCDWWFTDEAVLVDTAGRYTTQDSRQAVDNAGWLGFLDLLKTHRGRQPINGVIIAISLADLAAGDAAERGAHVTAIKARLRELHDRLGIRFPVYVLFTKADLIAGFVEFFEDLGREEREQVLGVTLAPDDESRPEGVVADFPAEFDALLERLNARLIDRVHQERDIRRRALIFGFPGQFASMREVASQFLTDIFQPSRYEPRALLRGVYFTSGTQEGTPIDRLLGAMAAAFGLNRPVVPAFGGSARSYFITRMLREVVFLEASMAGLDERTERRRLWTRRGAYAGLGLAVLAGVAVWTASYFSNERLIGALAAAVDDHRAAVTPFSDPKVADDDLKGVLPLLNRLRGLPAGFDDQREGRSAAMGFGLYQGDKLGEANRVAYVRALINLFRPRLLIHLGNRMRDTLEQPDPLRDALKAFLILSGQGPMDRSFVSAQFQPTWEALFPGTDHDAERRQLAAHLEALLAEHPEPVTAGEPLVEAARRVLAREAPAAHALRVIAKSAPVKGLPEWRLTDHVDANLGVAFTRAGNRRLSDGLPGRFTSAGFKAVLPAIGAQAKITRDESWVAGLAPTDPVYNDLERAILQAYLDDYASAWDGLLKDLEILRPDGWAKSADLVTRLSGSSSLLVKLLDAIRAETVLAPPIPGAAALPSAITDAAIPWLGPPLREFNAKFQAINALTQDAGGKSSDLAAVLDALKAAIGPLRAAAQAEHGVASGSADPTGEASGALRRLTAEAGLLPQPVSGWLQTITQGSAASGALSLRAQLDAAWKADVQPWCKRSLEGRYPFAGAGAPDMALDDFARLFAPGGLFDTFFTNRLARYVNTAARPWRWQMVDNTTLDIPAGVLAAFERARVIRDGFFPDGGRMASVRFDLRATAVSPATQTVAVDVDGQQFTFQPNTNQATQMVWPNPSGVHQAWVTFTPVPPLSSLVPGAAPPPAPERPRVGLNGPWAWYRLVQGRAQRTADRYLLTLSAGSGPVAQLVTLEIRPNSVVNPFSLTDLKDFRCPASF